MPKRYPVRLVSLTELVAAIYGQMEWGLLASKTPHKLVCEFRAAAI